MYMSCLVYPHRFVFKVMYIFLYILYIIKGDKMKIDKIEYKINYGEKLKKAREALGLTQEKVAELLGLGPRYISDIERNKTKGSIDTLIKLCNLYKLTPNDLLNEYINFDVLTNNIELSAFYSLNTSNQEIILDLIKFYNQKQKRT